MSDLNRRWPALCVDVESLATCPDGKIIEIGAVFFDPGTGEIGSSFKAEISLVGQEDRRMDADTCAWWETRKREGVVMPGEDSQVSIFLKQALGYFAKFVGFWAKSDGFEVWAWGSDFDFPMLKSAFAGAGLGVPWHYSSQRDARTFCKKLGVERLGDVRHRAMEDAGQEAIAVMAAHGKIKVLKQLESEGMPLPDPEAGWNAYRQELLETVGNAFLPEWKELPEQVRECWVVGIQAALGSAK